MTKHSQMLFIALIGAIVAGLMAAGCETGVLDPDNPLPAPDRPDTPDSQPDDPQPEPTLIGEWAITGGPLFPTPIGIPIETPSMTLQEDGTGHVTIRTSASGLLEECLPILHGSLGDSLAVDFRPAGFPTQLGMLLRYEFQGDDSMIALAQNGSIFRFQRAGASDPVPVCRSFAEVRRYEGLPPPGASADLEFDGITLFYPSDPALRLTAVDAATGSVSDSNALIYPFIVAMQGDAFWAHCGCGGSTDALLLKNGMQVDKIDTVDAGVQINIRGMSLDASPDALWLCGTAPDGRNLLVNLRNNTGAPDEKLAEVEVDHFLQSLAFDGSHLWSTTWVLRTVVLRFDAATGNAVDHWQIPVGFSSVASVAVHGGRMFLLGEDPAGKGLIVEVELPTAP